MTNLAFNFINLSPDTLWYALESIGIRADSGFLALNSYENRVYQFVDENKNRWVTKFYRPQRWSDEQILEEHEFCFELQNTEIPVVAPQQINGNSLHHYKGYRFALFPSVGGRNFEADNINQLEQIGQYLGRIHQVGKIKPFVHRSDISLEQYLYQPRQLLQHSDLIPDYLQNSFFHDLDCLIEQLEATWVESKQNIRLHGDCHQGNILWNEKPIFVDMDDAQNGPAIQDIWMLLSGQRHEKLAQLDLIIDAYNEFCDFEENQLKLIEPLRGLRMVHYMAWLATRWQDPAFPIAFPWFEDKKYWENQVLVFKEQIATLQETPLQLKPQW